ncbi:MAG: Gfo/Idh/MocA family oxidoreductase [Pseudomonadota bacterium]
MASLNAGIIGCGRITDLHVPGYARCDRARLLAICDVDGALLARRQAEWGVERTYRDHRALLADPDLDLVEIVTPHHLHRRLVEEAFAAGKHVSVQKPMALTLSDCDAMIAAGERAGKLLRVYENFVFFPPYVKAKELLAQGAIGEPLHIRTKLGSAMRGGWPVPLGSWVWRLDETRCGGGPTIFDDGNHKLSLALFLMGPVERVHAWIDRSFGTIDCPALIAWTHQGGRTGSLDATLSPFMTTPSSYYSVDERVEITGSEGSLEITCCTARLWPRPPLLLHRGGRTEAFHDLRHDWLDSFVDATGHLVDCLLDGGTPRLTGPQGREVVRFALAALRSAEIGRPVELSEIGAAP